MLVDGGMDSLIAKPTGFDFVVLLSPVELTELMTFVRTEIGVVCSIDFQVRIGAFVDETEVVLIQTSAVVNPPRAWLPDSEDAGGTSGLGCDQVGLGNSD